MRVFGDHAKIAITWQFGHSLSRFLRHNLSQSLVFKCILIKRKCHFRQNPFLPFKRGLFLKNFPWSPLSTFSKNAGFG